MNKLPKYVAFSELVSSIMKCVCFMVVEENNDQFAFDDLFKRAIDYFLDHTDENGMIDTEKEALSGELELFLKSLQGFDLAAIQQNIHHDLLLPDLLEEQSRPGESALNGDSRCSGYKVFPSGIHCKGCADCLT